MKGAEPQNRNGAEPQNINIMQTGDQCPLSKEASGKKGDGKAKGDGNAKGGKVKNEKEKGKGATNADSGVRGTLINLELPKEWEHAEVLKMDNSSLCGLLDMGYRVSKLKNVRDELIPSIKEEFKPLFKLAEMMQGSSKKGQSGELFVVNDIEKHFPDAEITEFGQKHVGHSCDILVALHAFKILIGTSYQIHPHSAR
jgi:hypothetical protein